MIEKPLLGAGTTRNAGDSLNSAGGSAGSLGVNPRSGSLTTKVGDGSLLKSGEKKHRTRIQHLPDLLGSTRRRDGVSATKALKNSLFGGPL